MDDYTEKKPIRAPMADSGGSEAAQQARKPYPPCCGEGQTIGSDIRVLSNLIHRAIENSPRKKQIDRVTGTNAWIIGYIADQKGRDVFQRDLERKFGITRSTASKVVNLMVKKGLIRRESIPEDARLKKLVLTERALEVLELMKEDFFMLEETLAAGFSEEELERFFDYTHRMQENVKGLAGCPARETMCKP